MGGLSLIKLLNDVMVADCIQQRLGLGVHFMPSLEHGAEVRDGVVSTQQHCHPNTPLVSSTTRIRSSVLVVPNKVSLSLSLSLSLSFSLVQLLFPALAREHTDTVSNDNAQASTHFCGQHECVGKRKAAAPEAGATDKAEEEEE